MRNLRKFKTEEEFEKYARTEDSLVANGLYLIESGCKVKYYDQDAQFYIEAVDDMSFNMYFTFGSCSYSHNLVDWITCSGSGHNIELKSGKKLYIKNAASDVKVKLGETRYKIGGNIDTFITTRYAYQKSFTGSFKNQLGLVSAEDLIIFKEGGTQYALYQTFAGCTNLTNGPKIIYFGKRTSIYSNKLTSTFEGCINLKKAPTIIGYPDGASRTFYGCTKINEVSYLVPDNSYAHDVFTTDWLPNIENGTIIINYNSSSEFVNKILPSIPETWEIKYYNKTTDKYFIKFTIDNTECIAEYGMTWEGWIKSKYNTIGLLDSDLSSIYSINKDLVSANTVINATRNNSFRINHVYIEHIDGTLYTTCEWISNEFDNELSNGVAIINDKCSFVIAKEDVGRYKWSDPNGSVIQGILNTSSSSAALQDYSGELNTELMLEVDTNGAGYHCANYKFANGQSGYLGAAGEWGIVYTYKNNIDDALKFIGGTGISRTTSHDGYWTSTQYPYSPDNNNAWTHQLGFNGYILWDGYGKNNTRPVRAFTKLKKSELQTEE